MNKIIKWVKDCVNRFISTNEEEEEEEEEVKEEEKEESTIVKGLGLVKHIRSYHCGYCWYKGSKTGIRLHLEYSHGVTINHNEKHDNEYTCKMCGFVAYSEYVCRKHMKRCGRRKVITHF